MGLLGLFCKGCGGTGGFNILEVCKCCKLVDGDATKKHVKFCRICGVYLCSDCWQNDLKRIQAFGRQFFQ